MPISESIIRPDTVISPRPSVSAVADPHGSFLRTKHFSSLNGLRALCCLIVIKEHVGWTFRAPRLVGELGWLGVDMFFVISGFLIVTLLIRERERHGSVSLRNFYARRTLRIFPIYYLLIFVVFSLYFAVSLWAPEGLRYYLGAFPVLLTCTQDIIPAPLGRFSQCWSLAMEEQFYLLWPTVEKFASRFGRWIILFGMLLANQAVNFGLLNGVIRRIHGNPSALSMPIFQVTFTPVLFGVLLAYSLNERRTFSLVYRLVGRRWSAFFFLGLLVAFCEASSDHVVGWPRLIIQTGLVLILASVVVRDDHFARPILAFPLLARVGVISYGAYLYHSWVIELLIGIGGRLGLGPMNPIGLFVLISAATVAVAEMSYRIIELPLLRMKDRFAG
jgi:peptidoglycan/LPS O-acetylase OafA/YrhL